MDQDKISGIKPSYASTNHWISSSTFLYAPPSNAEGLCFIWLDEMLCSSNDYLNEIIQPCVWNFFQNIPQCLAFIENQIRERNRIYLVTTGSFGYELFSYATRLMSTIPFVYIYCSHIDFHGKWSAYYSQIQGIFNDLSELGEQIKMDIERGNRMQTERNRASLGQVTITPTWLVRKNLMKHNLVTIKRYSRHCPN